MKIQDFDKIEKISWFPGHMHKAIKSFDSLIGDADVILEVRDARIPFSSRNMRFEELVRKHQKQRIILFNKCDLANDKSTDFIIEKYNQVGLKSFKLCAQEQKGLQQLQKDIIQQLKFSTVGLWLMICGIPNVGKSTIINQLKQVIPFVVNRRAIAKQAPLPCTTKKINGFKISDNPLAFMMDSPGIMMPDIYTRDQQLKLGLIGSIKTGIVSREHLVEFLLMQLNNHKQFQYIQVFKLKSQANNAMELILNIRNQFYIDDYNSAFEFFLSKYKEGLLGKVTLDDISILQ